MRLSWVLRGSRWRSSHLTRCLRCNNLFANDAPGAIIASSDTADEVEQCLSFRGSSEITNCPACAAPKWKDAVSTALYRSHFE